VLAPFTGDARPGSPLIGGRRRAALERDKALTLRSIKELEFDRAMGKLSQQDFDQMAGRLRARALGIMKQLEAGASLYREQVERDLAARVGATSKPALSASAEASARPRRSLGEGGQVGRAASHPVACACGTANDVDARFCKGCGAKLTETEKTK
jgi:hypothetical protein